MVRKQCLHIVTMPRVLLTNPETGSHLQAGTGSITLWVLSHGISIDTVCTLFDGFTTNGLSQDHDMSDVC